MSTQNPTASFFSAINKKAEADENGEQTQQSLEENHQELENQSTQELETQEQQTTQEEQETFLSYFEADEQEDTSDQQSSSEQVLESAKIKDKVKYNLSDYVDNYKDIVSDYFKYKNLNVDELSSEQVLREKMKKDNPDLDESDVAILLENKYGIGLKKIIPPEDALPDEIDAINAQNEQIERTLRLGGAQLKVDVAKARQELKQHVESLSLPEVELDVELNADPTTIIQQYQEKQIQEATELKEKVWVPSIKEAITKVGGFRQSFEIEVNKGDKVVADLTYKLTDKQKQELESYLADYTPHPSDNKYVINQETGDIDFTRFVSDKAKQLFAEDMLKAQSKELLAQFKTKFIKEDLTNFRDEPKRGSTATLDDNSQMAFYNKVFAKGSAHLPSKRG